MNSPANVTARQRVGYLLAAFLVVVATQPGGPLPVFAQDAVGQPQYLEAEQLAIETRFGEFDFEVEIADEPHEQSKGLMFRTDLGARQGMLFDFGQTRPVNMWMKDTPLSLDMVFIRADGTIAGVAQRTEPRSLAIIASPEPVRFVLELRGGISQMIGVSAGDRIRHRLMTGE